MIKKDARHQQPRPRSQRAFVRWLKENRFRLHVPMGIKKRTRRQFELSMKGLSKHIEISLFREGLIIAIRWDGEILDLLADIDTISKKTAEGYVCKLCKEEPTVFASREMLWREHFFEVFLAWINEHLIPASWLILYETQKGSSWAELAREPVSIGSDGGKFTVAASIPIWNN